LEALSLLKSLFECFRKSIFLKYLDSKVNKYLKLKGRLSKYQHEINELILLYKLLFREDLRK
jgi:CRISPR/Cas system-associated endoribonuclease Cas2